MIATSAGHEKSVDSKKRKNKKNCVYRSTCGPEADWSVEADREKYGYADRHEGARETPSSSNHPAIPAATSLADLRAHGCFCYPPTLLVSSV